MDQVPPGTQTHGTIESQARAVSTPILYQSCTKNAILLDLPLSIQDAQSSPFKVWSNTPPAQPYPSTEPKGFKLTRILEAIGPDRLKQDLDLEQEIRMVLNEIRAYLEVSGHAWCYPRLVPELSSTGKKEVDCNGGKLFASAINDKVSQRPITLCSTEAHNTFQHISHLGHAIVYNPDSQTIVVVAGTKYLIPSKSTFILSPTLAAGPNLNDTCLMCLPQTSPYALVGHFDLILMDPPWSNRSVRRKRAYATDENQPQSAFLLMLPILRHHHHSRGIVAVWITNKQAVKNQVCSALESLGLYLQQEWVWVKVTSNGEPLTQLNGVWRKPYEKLLIFGHIQQPVTRRIIVAVPDVHSRKPSLKRLFDEMLPVGYRALELFARSLTAGWWSWGDQVLHFQDVREWDADCIS